MSQESKTQEFIFSDILSENFQKFTGFLSETFFPVTFLTYILTSDHPRPSW